MATRSCRIVPRFSIVSSSGQPASVGRLIRDLGGELHIIEAEDPVEDVLSFAYRQHVTQMVVGESLRSKWQELLRWSFVTRLIQKASNIDVHVIARESDGRVGRDRVLVHEA